MTATSALSASNANPFPDLAEIRTRVAAPSPPKGPVPRLPTRPRVHDGSRTRFESRIAFGTADADEDESAEEIPAATRRFSLFEITTGLPDDSREAEEKRAERRLRELRSRVKVARATVASTPGLAGLLQADWRKAAIFYARFGITETLFRHGAAVGEVMDDSPDPIIALGTDIEGVKARESATFPTCSACPTNHQGVSRVIAISRR